MYILIYTYGTGNSTFIKRKKKKKKQSLHRLSILRCNFRQRPKQDKGTWHLFLLINLISLGDFPSHITDTSALDGNDNIPAIVFLNVPQTPAACSKRLQISGELNHLLCTEDIFANS